MKKREKQSFSLVQYNLFFWLRWHWLKKCLLKWKLKHLELAKRGKYDGKEAFCCENRSVITCFGDAFTYKANRKYCTGMYQPPHTSSTVIVMWKMYGQRRVFLLTYMVVVGKIQFCFLLTYSWDNIHLQKERKNLRVKALKSINLFKFWGNNYRKKCITSCQI